MRLMDNKSIARVGAAVFFTLPLLGYAQKATIDAGTTYQTIDGFGAASAFIDTVPAAVINTLYSSSGIHLKYVRTAIQPDYSDCTSRFGSCINAGSGATLSTSDLANVQAAVANGAVVWATLWSPPGSMKDNGGFSTGGNLIGNAANYTALAAIEASWVTLMTGTYGIPIYAVSVQNEPDMNMSYPSALWTAQQIHDFIPYLHDALAAAGYPNMKIMIAESGHWVNDYDAAAMNDSAVAADVGILASHSYFTSQWPVQRLNFNNVTTQHQWETEVSDSGAYDGGMTSGLSYAVQIHQWLTIAQVSSWNYWLISGQGRSDNSGLTDSSNNVAKRAYVMGNWAKYVTGMTEIAATDNPQSGVYVSAFEEPSTGAFAIVAINTNSGSISQQFSLSGLSAGSVTPNVTDANNSLVSKAAIPLSSGSFTATLGASSVTTFVGTGSGPAAPSNLTGTVIR